jgi:transposase
MGIAKADTRQRAIHAYLKQQGTQTQIAGIYGVDLRTFQRWLFRYHQTGVAAPLARGHRHAVYAGAALVRLDKLVQHHPDATLEELRTLTAARGSIMAVHRALSRLGYRYKKNAACQRTRA